MKESRTYLLSKTLIVSQLRASRGESGRSRVWERPTFILMADLIALVFSWLVTFEIVAIIPTSYGSLIDMASHQVLAFVPMFVLALVILAGIMFELSTSSRFASSDLVNWLPISKGEYVAASAISVGFIYSPYLCIAEGITLALSLQSGLLFAWLVSSVLSIVALVMGGMIVEILRASINRVYSAMSKRSGRAVLIVRLALTIVIIVAFQAVFYPNLLFTIMNGFVGALDASYFVPVVWPSLTVLAVIGENATKSIVFASLTVIFAIALFLIAVFIRTKYWSPSIASMTFANKKGYEPHRSKLRSWGFSDVESSLISKDFKGYTRQRELLPYLAMPFVFSAVLVLQRISISSSESASDISWLVAWFAGFSAVFVSSANIGIEKKSFAHAYYMPLEPEELIRAKLFSALLISLAGAFVMSTVATVFFSLEPLFFVKELILSVMVAIQSVFIGMNFATRDSDFVERPKPRYISMSGMLKAILVATGALLMTSLPILLLFGSQPYLSVLISVVIFSVISYLAYRYSLIGAKRLMVEMPH